MGLPWSRSRIAAIERGRKPIHVEDLVNLAALLTAKVRPTKVDELVDVDEAVALSGTGHVLGRDLAALLRGGPVNLDAFVLRTGASESLEAQRRELERDAARLRVIFALDGDEADVAARYAKAAKLHAAMGEADERARRALQEPATTYAALCNVLWGRSLTAERDARLTSGPEVSPASLAARRGRVTRELLDELRSAQARVNTAMGE